MTRKSKRSGTRGGRQGRLPTDIADAAEAALDDMLSHTPDDDEDEPKTAATAQLELADVDVLEEDVQTVQRREDPAADRRSKMPLPAPPRTTSVHTLGSGPVSRSTPPASAVPSSRVTPTPPVSRNTVPSPASGTRNTVPSPASSPRAASPVLVARNTVPSPASGARAASPPVRHTPTPPLSRPSDVPPVHTPTPVLPRPRPARELSEVLDSLRPATHAEPATGAWSAGDHTARVRTDLPVDLPIDLDEPAPPDVDDDVDSIAPSHSALPALQVAVYEESAQLGSVQSAIGAAGHTVEVAGTGRDGLQRVIATLGDADVDIDVVIASLPGGEPVIDAALAREPRPVVIASLSRSPVDAVNRAHASGADLVTLRPHDVERMAPILFAATRLLVEKRVALAARGAGRAGVDDLADAEPRSLLPLDVFQRMLDVEIGRAKRYEYPLSVALFAVEIAPPAPPPGIRGILRARAGNALIHSVRDIDFATQLEHERFLVLLPYTDLKAAAGLARRVIAAVAAGDPVVAGGRSFPPRVVGAVAGALPGQPVSFDKLVKHATRALDQARRDGAELAVQP